MYTSIPTAKLLSAQLQRPCQLPFAFATATIVVLKQNGIGGQVYITDKLALRAFKAMNSYISVPNLKFLSAELKSPRQFLVGLIAAMEAVTIVVSRPWTIYFHITKRR